MRHEMSLPRDLYELQMEIIKLRKVLCSETNNTNVAPQFFLAYIRNYRIIRYITIERVLLLFCFVYFTLFWISFVGMKVWKKIRLTLLHNAPSGNSRQRFSFVSCLSLNATSSSSLLYPFECGRQGTLWDTQGCNWIWWHLSYSPLNYRRQVAASSRIQRSAAEKRLLFHQSIADGHYDYIIVLSGSVLWWQKEFHNNKTNSNCR